MHNIKLPAKNEKYTMRVGGAGSHRLGHSHVPVFFPKDFREVFVEMHPLFLPTPQKLVISCSQELWLLTTLIWRNL